MKHVILGVGTGRCGSWSFKKLLDKQENTVAFHELGVGVDYGFVKKNLHYLQNRQEDVVADIGYYYNKYLLQLMEDYPEVKLIGLFRPCSEVEQSWMKHSGPQNHWSSDAWLREGEERCKTLSPYFPKFDTHKAQAIRLYWNRVWCQITEVQAKHPERVRVIHYKSLLNAGPVQKKLLKWCGIPDPSLDSIHLNRGQEHMIIHTPMDPSGIIKCHFCDAPESAAWYVEDKRGGLTSYACDECKRKSNLGRFNAPNKSLDKNKKL